MGFGGVALKISQTFLYAIEFCCAAIILGIYSYFLSVQADRNVPIATYEKAVEGISGAAVLYTIMAVLFTFCLGGKTFFALIAILLNVLFTGGFVALAVLTRDGAHSCKGNNVKSPLGNGDASAKQGFRGNGSNRKEVTYAASLGTACRLNKVCFAVAIIGAILFLLSSLVQFMLMRHHKKEKRFGPSPANGYKSGSGGKFWQRNRKNKHVSHDPEMAAAGGVPVADTATHNNTLAPGHNDYRPSHDTAYTQSTGHSATKPLVGGYHTAPTGTYNNAPITNGNYTAPAAPYPHSTPATNY